MSCVISRGKICAPTSNASPLPGDPTAMRGPHPYRSRTMAIRREAAPSTMARYPGVCTKTTSGRAHIASSVTGVAAIPADSSLADWPLSYADLEPYYDRAEYELGVSGKAGNLQGRKLDGGNVFEAARRRDYPLPPLLAEPAEALFDEAAQKLGYHPFSSPRAILSQAYRGRSACTYCGYCQAFG